MAATYIARISAAAAVAAMARRLKPTSASVVTHKPFFLSPGAAHRHHKHFARHFCASSADPNPAPPPPPPSEMKHQEITGPTVERDLSALAQETRQTLSTLRGTLYSLSNALAVLGVAHAGVGAYLAYSMHPLPDEVAVQSLMAFAFPFSAAFLIRRTVKPIIFFNKMEEQGRLQILTLSMQSIKGVNLLLLRTRVVAISCVIGVSAGTAAALWMR